MSMSLVTVSYTHLLDELKNHYDMTTMLIVTNTNGEKIMFKNPDKVTRGEAINLE